MEPISDITIYAPDGTVLMTVPLQSNAESVEELMRADYVQLSWNAATGDVLPAGAYIMWNGEKYSLLDPYEPEQSDELQRVYTPQFQSRVMGWGKIPFFHYNVNTATNEVLSKEPDWSLTGTGSILMQSVIDAIGRETGELWSIEVDESLNNGTQTVPFESTDIFSGLNAIASAFEAEWWADKTKTGGESGVIGSHGTIYLARRIALGDPVALTVGDNVGVPSVTGSKEGYYNRFFIFGSTRNVTQDFDGANVNTLVNKRLTLDPVKYPDSCIDMRTDKEHEPALTKFLVFDDIYPRAHLKISDAANGLRARPMYRIGDDTLPVQIGTDANGKPIYDQYVIWYFRPVVSDTGKEFAIANPTYYNPKTNPTGDLIPDKNLSVHFNSGELNGREFELHYVDKDDIIQGQSFPEYGLYTPDFPVYKGDFEIKIIEEGSMIIPTGSEGGVSPTEGAQLTLFNLRMPAEYTASSQKDLEEAANDTITERYTADLNNYTLQSNPVAFHADDPDLTVGRAVTYSNGDYSYTTRVIRIVRKLDSPKQCEQEITIGSEKIKGTTQTLKEDVVVANRNIEVLAALNSLTETITQQYMRTQQSMLEGFRRIADMWRFDPDNPDTIYSKYNVYSLQAMSAKGSYTGDGGGSTGGGSSLFGLMREWPTANPGNATTDALGANLGWELRQSVMALQNAGYATQTWVQQQGFLTQHQDISHLLSKTEAAGLYQPKGNYLTQHQTIYALTIQRNGVTVGTYTPNAAAKTIDISDVASAAALTSHISDTVVHITSAERTKWNKTTTDLSAILGTDSDTIINKWEEVIAFLDTYTEADTLANLLSNKADKTQLADYVTLATAQTITGKKLFSGGMSIRNITHNRAMPFFLGIDAFTDGGDVHFIESQNVAKAIGVYTKTEADGKYVTSLDVSGDYVRYIINGTAHNITVPYAIDALRLKAHTLNNGDDLNTFKTSGLYVTSQTSVVLSLLNRPTGSPNQELWLEARNMGNYGSQFLFTRGSLSFEYWVRTFNTTGFSAWQKILTDTNYAPILDTRYLTKATFDDLFEKVNIGTSAAPVWVIHAKYGIYSDYSITAKGSYNGGTGSGGTGGGNSYGRLDNWNDYVAGSGDVLSADLGYGLHTGLDTLTAKVNAIKGLDAGTVAAGTYTKVTTDTYGRVVSGTTLTVADIPSLPWSIITSGKPTTLAGYGITNAMSFTASVNNGYVAARFADASLAQIAAEKYIELWQSPYGWFNLKAGKFITDGGTASHFVKGDGTLDSNTYALASALGDYYTKTAADGRYARLQSANNLVHASNEVTFVGGMDIDRTIHLNYRLADTTTGKITVYEMMDGHAGHAAVRARQLMANVANGTAPLVVYSTTLVPNLNADLLDGYHSSSFPVNKAAYCNDTSIYDLRFNVGSYDRNDFPSGQYYAEYPSPYGVYLSLAPRDKNSSALIFIDSGLNSVSADAGHVFINTRKAGDGNTAYTGWKKLAYITDTVANASSLGGIAASEYLTKNNYAATLDGRYVNAAGDTMTGALTVPRVNASGALVLNGGSAVYLRYADKDTTSLVLSSVAFKPFDTANGVFSLGSASARWTTLYSNTINVTSMALVSNLNADMLDGHHKADFNAVARLGTKAGESSGYYKIKIKSTVAWMLGFKILAYQHYTFDEINISGYNYGANYWYRPSAGLVSSQGNNPKASIDVRFGYDSAWNLWVAIPAAQYTGIAVTDVVNGYDQVSDIHSLFEIVYEATLTGTVQTTITASRHAMLTDNVASATKLSDNAAYKAWGQTYFANGKPQNVSGTLTGVTDISMSGAISSGNVKFGRNGSVMELLSGNNEFVLSMAGSYAAAYINYRASAYGGYIPAKWVWNAGTPTTYADFDLGALNARGNITLAVGKQLKSGTGAIEWDAALGMWKFTGGIYSDGPITAKGQYSGGGTGGTGGTAYGRYDDATWATVPTAEDVLAATLGMQLNNRVKTLEGKNYLDALAMVQSGSGNAVTAVALSADKKTITVTKGANYLTSITKPMVEAVLTGNITSHTHSQYALATALGNYFTKDESNSRYLPVKVYNCGNGCLVKLKVASTLNCMVMLMIQGNSYKDGVPPINTTVQFYNYQDGNKIVESSAVHYGNDFGNINAFNYDGYIYAWFKQNRTFQTYAVTAIASINGELLGNAVDTISNAVMPTSGVTRLCTITPIKALRTDNYTSVLDSRYYTESEINTKLGSYAKLQAPNNFVHSGNEITMIPDGFDSNLWFNYRAGSSGTGQVTDYNMGDGAHGYANVKAKGFVKNGSSDSYLLLGGGGHKALSDLAPVTALTDGSVTKVGTSTVGSSTKPIYLSGGVPTACAYAFGNGSGNAALNNGTLNTNLNADLLDGVHAAEFARGGTATYAANDGTGARWIRIATFSSYTASGIITIENTWTYNPNAAVVFAFGVGYRGNTNYSITQIGGVGTLFTKARIVYPTATTEPGFIEVYYNESTSGHNSLYVRLANAINVTLIQSATTGAIPSTHAAYEQEFTLNGIAALNVKATTFIGTLSGNAATASALATARTINGTSFDGSANITTANWGTARNLYIQDHTSAHYGGAVSVNGSADVRLKLPSVMDLATLNVTTAVWLNGTSAMLRGKGKYGGFNLYAGYSAVANEIFRIDGENPDGSFACNIMKSDLSGNVAFGPSNVDAAYRLLVKGNAKVDGDLTIEDRKKLIFKYDMGDIVIRADDDAENTYLMVECGDGGVDIDGTLRVRSLVIGNAVITYNKTTGMLEVTKGITSHGAITAKAKR